MGVRGQYLREGGKWGWRWVGGVMHRVKEEIRV